MIWFQFLVASVYTQCYHLSRPELVWVRFLVASVYTPCYHHSRPGLIWVRFLVASVYTPCYHLSRPGLIWVRFLVASVYTPCYHLSRPGLSRMLQEALYVLFSVMQTTLSISYSFILVKRGVLLSVCRNISPTCCPIKVGPHLQHYHVPQHRIVTVWTGLVTS